MKIDLLKIENFRNIEDVEIKPDCGINVICGRNAQGKTNLIEALWMFTGAKSFRGNKSQELVRFSCDYARLFCEFFENKRDNTAQIIISKNREVTLNDVKKTSPTALSGNFAASLFSPSELRIVSDGPKERRRFLDMAIYQIFPSYVNKIQKYQKVLAQKNALLFELRNRTDMEIIADSYDEQLAETGAEIVSKRQEFCNRMDPFFCDIFDGISKSKEQTKVRYETRASTDKNEFYELLQKARKNDISTLSTSIGPHRDELEIYINEKKARVFASQGQKRSVALALKLSEAHIIEKFTGNKPIILLDDVMSELDPERQEYVLNHIKGWQVFITVCDPSNINNLDKGKVFLVEEGRIRS